MRREFHVRFCEGPEGQFLRATRLIVLVATDGDPEETRAVAEAEKVFCLGSNVTVSPAVVRTGDQDPNPWGLPGEVGPIGGHLMRLGDAAVPALRARLDDATPVTYGGSEDATIGNRHAYRVKDIAAFYSARLAPSPYAVLATPAERDREIAKLAALLDEP
jgi:hypothetical protein